MFIANDTLLMIVGISDHTLEYLGVLTKVLHIPKLFTNLISFKKLVNNTLYCALIDEDISVIFDKVQQQRIEVVRECGGLLRGT